MIQPHDIAALQGFASDLQALESVLAADFTALARIAAPVAVTALWQGATIAMGLLLFLRIAPRSAAAHRFTAWSAGFAAVAALPFLPSLASLLARSAAPAVSNTVVSSSVAPIASHPLFALDDRWALAIAVLWLAASAYRAAELVFHAHRLHVLWNSSSPLSNNALAGISAANESAEVCSTTRLDRPSVIGFFRPRILLPEWLLTRLTPAELNQVILHETEHLRRRDDWTNLLQKIFLVVFPLNPALAWIDRRLGQEREMACDEAVVRRTQAPRAYAACLASLAERGLEQNATRAEALSLAAWRRRPELVHRVHIILRRGQSLNPATAAFLLVGVTAGLLFGSVELARTPQIVAFVASQAAQTRMAALQSAPAFAAYPSGAPEAVSAIPGVRAIAARAILPANANRPAIYGDAPLPSSSRHAARATDEIASREPADSQGRPDIQANAQSYVQLRAQLLKAEIPAAKASNRGTDQNSGGQFIVFTEWEQVDAAPRSSRVIADYDPTAETAVADAASANATGTAAHSAAAQSQSAAMGQPAQFASIPAAQFTVTQLIFKIAPAAVTVRTSAGSTASSSVSHPKPPTSRQSIALPLEDGWLVLQL